MKRSWLKPLSAILGILAPISGAMAMEDKVVVMTSYPQEVVSRFEAAFERRHPGTRIELLWRMPHDALPFLLEPSGKVVDVYWTPSLENFTALAARNLLRPLDIDTSGLPPRIGRQPVSDPAGRYLATETAGFGLSLNTDYLKRHGLPEPRDWGDLTDPVYAGHVNMPIPAQVGFAPAMIEIILQAKGWAEGWALLSAISANANLVGTGTFVTDEVARGERGVGLTIDFFTASAAANGAPVKFVYPRPTSYSPAHVAILGSAPHPDAARAFVEFILSEEGQTILFQPDIRKLPVRPSVYAKAPAGYHNPFTATEGSDFALDLVLVRARRALAAAMFEQMITTRVETLRRMWTAIRTAEAAAARSTDPSARERLAQARRLATALPLTSDQAHAAELLRTFEQRRSSADAGQAAAAEEARWSAFFTRNYAEAVKIADDIAKAQHQ